MVFLSSMIAFAFFSGILIQRMMQREEQHARNERTLHRVVKYLKETAPAAQ